MPPSVSNMPSGAARRCRTPEKKKHSRPPRTTPKKKLVDDRSKASDKSASSGATPSSVVVGGASLTRDLSDLSGSYLNGNTAPQRGTGNVPKTVYPSDQSNTSYQRPWRQAKVLSSREPTHPQPPQDCDDSIGVTRKGTVVFVRNGVVEVSVKQQDDMSTSSSTILEDHHRIPLIVLLMDPGRKIYELMQLWIDVTADSVRDVLHAVQHSLADKWRQDYDGLFQVRNNHFDQLIHILNVSKYDVQPHEIWVAKPWAMSAKSTVAYASSLLNHLKNADILSYWSPSHPDQARWKFHRPNAKTDDVILILSKEAQKRIYVPDGILKHHHASQFLSFSPGFGHETPVRVDVLAADSIDDGSSTQLSDSGSFGSEEKLVPKSVISDIAEPRREEPKDKVPVAEEKSIEAALQKTLEERLAKSSTTSCFPNRKVTDSRGLEVHEDSRRSISTEKHSNRAPDVEKQRAIQEERDANKNCGSITRALSKLNCGKRTPRPRNNFQYDEGLMPIVENSETHQNSSTSLWKVWEDESQADQSIDSSHPLLFVKPTSLSDWIGEF